MNKYLLMAATATAITLVALCSQSSSLMARTAETPATPTAEPAQRWPSITVAVSGSATVSAKDMKPGSEMWAEWISLPAGQSVTEPASAAKWAYMEMVLNGSAVVSGEATPMCSSGVPLAIGTEREVGAGDVEVCNFAMVPGSRTESGKTEPYVFATLSVGGPWNESMEDTGGIYRMVNGVAKSASVPPQQFGEVEKEILQAGEMQISIRRITLPRGAQISGTDRYPTLRMVESGQLTVNMGEQGSEASKSKILAALDTIEWTVDSAGKQITLTNNGDVPVRLVEWSVAPGQGATH